MYRLRRWSTRHANLLDRVYLVFEHSLLLFYRLCGQPTHPRFDRIIFTLENFIKRRLFDSRMCGACVLGSTGMTCPMNCPKKMRNGPCGGVRQNGHCEINPAMPCVWVEATIGNQQIEQGIRILTIQAPVDHRLQNTSSWLRAVRTKIAPGVKS